MGELTSLRAIPAVLFGTPCRALQPAKFAAFPVNGYESALARLAARVARRLPYTQALGDGEKKNVSLRDSRVAHRNAAPSFTYGD